ERNYLGGSCVNYGCTPTKALQAASQRIYMCKSAPALGTSTFVAPVRWQEISKHIQGIVRDFRSSTRESLVDHPNVDVHKGEAAFISNHNIKVSSEEGAGMLSGNTIIINTGATASIPPVEGLEDIPWLDKQAIFELKNLPERLLIVGGGHIGVEFAQMFQRLGSQVVLLEAGNQLLRGQEPEIVEGIQQILEQEGIEIHTSAEITRFTTDQPYSISAELASGDEVSGTHVLLAIGRVPVTEALNLASTDIETDEKGYIHVNNAFETAVEGVFAIGDVIEGPMFTHRAYHDHYLLGRYLLEGKEIDRTGYEVPFTLFVDPQFSSIGATREDLESTGQEYLVAILPANHIGRAVETGNATGNLMVYVDPHTDLILGAHFWCYQAGELISIIQVAIENDVPYTNLQHMMFAHPTMAEGLNSLFSNIEAYIHQPA
ncbi:MAG: FAD-dependent oxidoreductase, partial [Bacteroidota bacterium]